MSATAAHGVRRYLVAVGVWAVAWALTIALAPFLEKVIFMLFWPAILVSAWYCGRGPALVVVVLSIFGACFLLVHPAASFVPSDPRDLLTLAFFAVLATAVAEITTGFRRNQRRAILAEGEAGGRAAALQEQTAMLEAQAVALAQSNAVIRDSESRFRRLFVDNPIPMWIFDVDTMAFLDVNAAAIRQYGYSHDEFLAMTIRDIRPRTELGRLATSVALPDGMQPEGRGTFCHRRKDGSEFEAEVTVQNASHEGRSARLVLAIDVSEREQLLQRERDARAVAEEANRVKTDFLATMSHELRTPLNAIGGFAELVAMGIHGPITEGQRDAISRIQRSQRHLLSLINDVLNFAKLAAGRVEYHLEELPVSLVIDAIEPLVSSQLAAKSLQYTRHECTEEIWVRADADKLRQILLNLLSNAIKFTEEGGRVDTSCGVRDDVVRIVVRDTGIGIAPERIGQIFEPFVQVGRGLNTAHEGTGLGLSISRDLARAMGGELTVSSTTGEGSEFVLSLPRSTPG